MEFEKGLCLNGAEGWRIGEQSASLTASDQRVEGKLRQHGVRTECI